MYLLSCCTRCPGAVLLCCRYSLSYAYTFNAFALWVYVHVLELVRPQLQHGSLVGDCLLAAMSKFCVLPHWFTALLTFDFGLCANFAASYLISDRPKLSGLRRIVARGFHQDILLTTFLLDYPASSIFKALLPEPLSNSATFLDKVPRCI
ncbi:hypothetical protein FPV67DRAFT_637357 [Lyophyllum atratum]|nr:hypothetical protein FPV67DRAFT_637357 [Lyophyllum atratum]